MTDKKEFTINVKGLDPEIHKQIKAEAVRRGMRVNDLYLKIIPTGAKRMNIVADG